jgi:hypothetical protein
MRVLLSFLCVRSTYEGDQTGWIELAAELHALRVDAESAPSAARAFRADLIAARALFTPWMEGEFV